MTRRRALLLGAVAVVAVLAALSLRLQRVETDDMAPTLTRGDYVVLNRLAYFGRLPFRGEVVLVNGQLLRVIGIGGDTVEMKDGKVLIGGEGAVEVPEPYVVKKGDGKGKWRVPGSRVFVLADQRVGAHDSRDLGLVPVRDLEGQAIFLAWPLERRCWLYP